MTTEACFEKIATQYGNQLPFVVYRKPDEDQVVAILQCDNTLHKTLRFTETGFVFAPFNANEGAILIPLETSDVLKFSTSEIDNVLSKESEFSFENPVSKESHIALVQKGIDAINKGEFKKVVLSRIESVDLSQDNPISVFKNILAAYNSAFVYCFYHPKVGVWLGASPETLLKTEGNRFFTTALAGTQKYQGTLNVDWQQKEITEQQLVTNYIEDRLKPLVSQLRVSEPQTFKAGNVVHLKTNISGLLNSKHINIAQIIKALHPTPAVCGLPKDKTKAFILKHENYHRDYYTGFLGELNFKEKIQRSSHKRNIENMAYASVKTVSNLVVNLRCMQLKNQKALIYVGGGITQDSIPSAEWEETKNKLQTMKSVL